MRTKTNSAYPYLIESENHWREEPKDIRAYGRRSGVWGRPLHDTFGGILDKHLPMEHLSEDDACAYEDR